MDSPSWAVSQYFAPSISRYLWGASACMCGKKTERRRVQGRTHSVNEPLRFSTSENLLLGHLTPKSKSSGANSNCLVLLLEFQLLPLLCTVLLLFLFWFKTADFLCDLVEGHCCFSSKGPLSEVTAVGQAFEKRVTSAKSLPEALGMSACLWCWWILNRDIFQSTSCDSCCCKKKRDVLNVL